MEGAMSIKTVGVIGSGLMGVQIAGICASAGHKTFVMKATDGDLSKPQERLMKNLEKEVKKGKMTAEDRDKLLSNISWTAHMGDLANCELIIETIVENVDQKKEFFSKLDDVVNEEAIFATNTSTLCITELMASTSRKDRFVGTHFFNPVTAMKLVEVVPTLSTHPDVVETVSKFIEKLGKVPVVVRDKTGFIVNRLLVPYLLDAIRCFEEGLASIEALDTAMRFGAGYPMGPFVLIDYIGIDVVHAMASTLFEELKQPHFAPPPLLKRMLLSGMLGKKNGKGFYDYSTEPPKPNDWLARGSNHNV